jgi:hypothetical protein
MAIVAAPSRLLLVGALIGNAIVVVVWIVSRTVGLPLGPEAWAVEPASFLDVLSTFLEIGIVAGVATVLSRPSLARDVGRGGVAVGALALLLIALTTAGVASGGKGHGEEGGHDEHVSTDATGLARADLGAGRELQVLVDEGEQLSLMHLTFFNDEGTALDVTSALVLATPTEGGDAIQVPTQEFEPGHYVTTLDLEPGEWTFEVSGNAGEGGDFDTTFNSTLG